MAKLLKLKFSGEIEIPEELVSAVAAGIAAAVGGKPQKGKSAKDNDDDDDDGEGEDLTDTILEIIEEVGEDEVKKVLKENDFLQGRKALAKQIEAMDEDTQAEVLELLEEEFPDDEDGEGDDGDDEVTVDSVKAKCQEYQKEHGAAALKEILATYEIKTANAVKNLEEDDLVALDEDISEALDD